MNLSVDPHKFKGQKIGTAQEQSTFMFELSQILVQMATTINTVQGQINSLQNPSSTSMGTIATNQTINASGSQAVSFSFGVATVFNPTITIQNLGYSVPVFFQAVNTSGSARTITIAASTPGAASYSVAFITSSGGTPAVTLSVASVSQAWAYGMSISNNGLFFLSL